MRDAAEKALRYTQGSSRQGLEDDELLRLAVTKLVEIVGEAAKQVSEPTRAAHAAVPWSAAARMRDRLTHHYFDVDLDVLWATITEDLPLLIDVLPDEPPQPRRVDDRIRVRPICALTPATCPDTTGRARMVASRSRWSERVSWTNVARGGRPRSHLSTGRFGVSSPWRRTHEKRPLGAGSRRSGVSGHLVRAAVRTPLPSGCLPPRARYLTSGASGRRQVGARRVRGSTRHRH
jgi:uncharacterized protein with HEPN domain